MSSCWTNVDATAIRARTPTSAGMASVDMEGNDEPEQGLLWDKLPHFGVSKETIAKTHQFLKRNMHRVLDDALKGQCTKIGGTCKEESREQLERMQRMVREQSEAN